MFKKKTFKIIIFILAQLTIYTFFISVLSSRLKINTDRGLGSWQLVNEGSAAFAKSFAASHLYLGLSVTKGQSFFYNGPGQPPRPYLHQPPGIGLTIWMMDHFLGYQGSLEQFWPLFFPLIFQTISFVLIAVFTLLVSGSFFLSICSTLIFSLLPISAYFGHVTESMIITFPFLLVSLVSYYYYIREKKLRHFLFFLISTTISAFYCWTGIYIIPAVLIHQLIYRKFRLDKEQWKFIIISTLWEILLVILLFGQIYWADNFTFNALKDGYNRRILGYTNTQVSVFGFIEICLHHIIKMYTWPVCITSVIFLVVNTIRKIRNKKISLVNQIIIISVLVGLGPVVSLPYISTGHQFWFFSLMPFFLFSSIAILKYLYDKFQKKKGLFFIISFLYIFTIFLFGKNIIYNYYTANGEFPLEKGHFVEVFNVWSK